jgi:hypothetical protein
MIFYNRTGKPTGYARVMLRVAQIVLPACDGRVPQRSAVHFDEACAAEPSESETRVRAARSTGSTGTCSAGS